MPERVGVNKRIKIKKLIFLFVALISFECSPKKEQEIKRPYIPVDEPIELGYGTINSIVDGYEVEKVNLSKSPSDKKLICSLKKGDKVKIIKKEKDFYLVQSTDNQECRGYCMTGFVETE
jgi:hypothetical protein